MYDDFNLIKNYYITIITFVLSILFCPNFVHLQLNSIPQKHEDYFDDAFNI